MIAFVSNLALREDSKAQTNIKRLDNITNFKADIFTNSEISLYNYCFTPSTLICTTCGLSIHKTLPGPIPFGSEALYASSCVSFSSQLGSIVHISSSIFSFTLFVPSTPILTNISVWS